MLGRPFDPLGDVDMIELMLWRYTKDELMRDINLDQLDTSNLLALGQLPTQNSIDSAHLLDLVSASGGEVEDDVLMGYVDTSVYAPETHSYFIMVAEGSRFGHGTKMISFFDPDPDEDNTEVRLSDDSATLDYTADLSSLKRVAVPPATPNIVFDWEDTNTLVRNAMGQEWIPTRITDVQVAHYREKTPSDLEREFLDLELIADEMYTVFLSAGQRVNLAVLTDESGAPFPGIDGSGTWILALKCESCANPAPHFLTILHPCP